MVPWGRGKLYPEGEDAESDEGVDWKEENFHSHGENFGEDIVLHFEYVIWNIYPHYITNIFLCK